MDDTQGLLIFIAICAAAVIIAAFAIVLNLRKAARLFSGGADDNYKEAGDNMNETVKTILSRQTVRSYKQQQISHEELELILKCAERAPSGRNSQPCHVRVVQSKEMLESINTDFKLTVGYDTPAYTRWDVNPVYQTAPTLIFIFAENDCGVDAGIMVENMVIAAQSMGLASCIIASIGALFGGEFSSKWKEKLEIPDNYRFQISVAIGIPDEKPEMKPRFDDRIKVIKDN